jgi:signal transduction histidine kinase
MPNQPVPQDIEILAVRALRLLGGGAAPSALAARFRRVQLPRDPDGATKLLAYLAQLGLVRVSSTHDDEPYYVLTTLGHEYADTLADGSHPMSAGLAELERLRAEFMSTIAHELRTPLTAVRTCVSLLLEPAAMTAEPAIRIQLLENVARSADRMQRMVADLLDLVSFRAGQIRLQSRRFDARDLVHDAASIVAPLMEVQGQVLEFSTPDEPAWVFADRRRLEQVLVNLLSNAEKFSPNGARIRIACHVDDDVVTWSVRDDGPGISREDQAHLFERFFTREPLAEGHTAGAGLGLPIALAIVQAHGGTITVDSAIGHGSTFTVSVPRNAGVEDDE